MTKFIPPNFLSVSARLGQSLLLPGIPRGSILEIFGASGVGKTTFALEMLLVPLRGKERILYCDLDQSLDLNYARSLGLSFENWIFFRPESEEKTFASLAWLLNSNSLDLVIIDSVASLKSVAQGTGWKDPLEPVSSLLLRRLPRVCHLAKRSLTTIVFVDQLHQCLDHWGNIRSYTSGGCSLKLKSQIRILVKSKSRFSLVKNSYQKKFD